MNSILGEFDFLNGFGCDLNAEGVKFEQYLKTGTGQGEFKTVKIRWFLIAVVSMFLMASKMMLKDTKDQIIAMQIDAKKRIIRIYRIADFKRGFSRNYKFGEFTAFELGVSVDKKGAEESIITYHSRYETGDISPMMSEKNVQELYRYLNWVVLGR